MTEQIKYYYATTIGCKLGYQKYGSIRIVVFKAIELYDALIKNGAVFPNHDFIPVYYDEKNDSFIPVVNTEVRYDKFPIRYSNIPIVEFHLSKLAILLCLQCINSSRSKTLSSPVRKAMLDFDAFIECVPPITPYDFQKNVDGYKKTLFKESIKAHNITDYEGIKCLEKSIDDECNIDIERAENGYYSKKRIDNLLEEKV